MSITNTEDLKIINSAEFDWADYESNTSYKTFGKDRIMSNEIYAQELYNLMSESYGQVKLQEPIEKSIIFGHVVRKTDRYAEIDISWRESAYIDLAKEDPEFIKYIQEGHEIEVQIKSISNKSTSNTYTITASYTDLVKHRKFQEIKDSIGREVAFSARVKSLVYGGYFLEIDGIEVFMPGSQGGMNKLINFESLLGQDIYVCPINYDVSKNYMVVSHRAFLKTQVPIIAEALELGEAKSGVVTGTSKFGVFVEFDGCLTGLIHKSDLTDDDAARYRAGTLHAGDEINCKIKEVVDPFRIVLTQNEVVPQVDPWDGIESRYKTPSVVTGVIKKIARFGIFIELEPKVTGLLHKSEYEGMDNIFEQGNEISVDLYRIDTEEKKLYFKL